MAAMPEGPGADERTLAMLLDLVPKPVFLLDGDEFGVLVEDLECRAITTALADDILAGLPGRIDLGDVAVDVSLSIGMAFAEAGRSHLELLQSADAATYVAQQNGEGRWIVHVEVAGL